MSIKNILRTPTPFFYRRLFFYLGLLLYVPACLMFASRTTGAIVEVIVWFLLIRAQMSVIAYLCDLNYYKPTMFGRSSQRVGVWMALMCGPAGILLLCTTHSLITQIGAQMLMGAALIGLDLSSYFIAKHGLAEHGRAAA